MTGFVVREGKVRGAGRYTDGPPDADGRIHWRSRQCFVASFRADCRSTADEIARLVGGRVVRLRSRAEVVARARAAGRAEGLREALGLVADANPHALSCEAGAFSAHHITRDGAKDVRDAIAKRLAVWVDDAAKAAKEAGR